MNKVHFSSEHSDWETPQDLIDDLSKVFTFDLDVCASRPNVCDNYFNKLDNGLAQDWTGMCWMNPPYGKGIDKWMDKASEYTVVCLVPARTDSKWWHKSVLKASFVVFIKNRLYFSRDGKAGRAPFPSAFILFGEVTDLQREKLSSYGWAVQTVSKI